VNPGLLMALLRGGKALVMSKTVRLALAEYLLASVRKHDVKPEAPKQ
jgi:hypothetical protein